MGEGQTSRGREPELSAARDPSSSVSLLWEGDSEITPTGSPGAPVGSEKVPWLLQGACHFQPGLSTDLTSLAPHERLPEILVVPRDLGTEHCLELSAQGLVPMRWDCAREPKGTGEGPKPHA